MNNYTLELDEDTNGDLQVTFPDDLLDLVGWQYGDVLSWDLKGAGVILRKLNDSGGYEPVE